MHAVSPHQPAPRCAPQEDSVPVIRDRVLGCPSSRRDELGRPGGPTELSHVDRLRPVQARKSPLHVQELARRLDGSGITANALHPGVFVASEFGKNNGGFLKVGISVAQRLGGISVEKGARTSVYLASSREVEGETGKYFVKCRPRSRRLPRGTAQSMREALGHLGGDHRACREGLRRTMDYVGLGRTGLKVSRICLGTMT